MAEMEVPPAEKEETSEHQEDLTYRQDMFYTKSANTTVLLQDGKTLSFSKDILCYTVQSEVLDQMFFGPLKDTKVTEITDVEYDTFKLFLGCLMGYEQYTFENAMEIFPVVWKYQIEQAIEECVKTLKPSEMDERVCHILNMASLCSCEKLFKEILAFISTYNSYKFIEDERYCHLLEPDSIKAVMSELPMDSYLLEKILKWGEYFIKENKQFGDSVHEFFEKADLLKYFKLEYFETTGALYVFRETEIGKKIFPSDKILNYLQKSENLTHRNSTWKKMEKGMSRAEEIDLPKSGHSKIEVNIEIEGNKVVYYEAPESDTLINCHVSVSGIDYSGNPIFTKNDSFNVTNSISDIYSRRYISYDHVYSTYNYDRYRNLMNLSKLKVKLTWTFLTDCRVLLTNKPGDKLNRDMYFAKNVTLCPI